MEQKTTTNDNKNRYHKIWLSLLFTILTCISIPASSYGLSIGAAPGAIDIGDVEPGEDYLAVFYLITNSEDELMIDVNYIDVQMDKFTKSLSYPKFINTIASQEDISGWIEFPENPLFVNSGESHVTPDGSIRYQKKVTGILHVPRDAEPGYHIGGINMNPSIVSGGGKSNSVTTIGITRVLFAFNVVGPKEPLREGKIVGIEAEREPQRVRIDILFKNTGTTTIYTRIKELLVYDDFNHLTTRTHSGGVYVKPDSYAILSAYWDGDQMKTGKYRVNTTLNYITGDATKEGSVTIPDIVTSRIMPTQMISKCEFPWTITIIILIVMLIIYFKKVTDSWDILVAVLAIILIFIILIYFITCTNLNDIPWWITILILSIIGLYIYWKI